MVICRLYDLESDPEKIIKTLYTKLQENNGLQVLKKEDHEYLYNSDKNFRLVTELNNELIASTLIKCDIDFEKDLSVELFSVVTLEKYQGT